MPGVDGARCETVTYRGPDPGVLRVYAADVSSTRGLSADLRVRVDEGDGPAGAECATPGPRRLLYDGPALAFPTAWQDAASTSVPGHGAHSVNYRISYQLPESTPNSAQGGTAGLRLVWEVRPN